MEDYPSLHFLDNIAGKKQALFEGHRDHISRVKNKCGSVLLV